MCRGRVQSRPKELQLAGFSCRKPTAPSTNRLTSGSRPTNLGGKACARVGGAQQAAYHMGCRVSKGGPFVPFVKNRHHDTIAPRRQSNTQNFPPRRRVKIAICPFVSRQSRPHFQRPACGPDSRPTRMVGLPRRCRGVFPFESHRVAERFGKCCGLVAVVLPDRLVAKPPPFAQSKSRTRRSLLLRRVHHALLVTTSLLPCGHETANATSDVTLWRLTLCVRLTKQPAVSSPQVAKHRLSKHNAPPLPSAFAANFSERIAVAQQPREPRWQTRPGRPHN